jgi:glycerol-3-phosphate O-acyltransferase
MAAVNKDIFKLVLEQLNEKYATPESKKQLIEDSFYWEKRRLQKSNIRKGSTAESRFYLNLEREFTSEENRINSTFRKIVKNHLKEIQGNFSERMFALSRRLLTHGLKYLINRYNLWQMLSDRKSIPPAREKIKVTGHVELAREFSRQNTLVVVPNHMSNMDSVVLGYGMTIAGLPPFFYGAGLNLFTNRIVSYFMNNLGAYKVDRQKRHELYKEILKAYAVAMLIMGQHSLFFPGGTRLRSGGIETRLKKGLLGTTMTATRKLLQEGESAKKLVVLPVNLNYGTVLESQGMIKDYFKASGNKQYYGEPQNVKRNKPRRRRLRNIFRLDTDVYIHIGQPMDIFGHQLNTAGESIDATGRSIDIGQYFLENGAYAADENRDQTYTGFLAGYIENAYHRDNYITDSNLVCFAIYRFLTKRNATDDIYQLMYLSKENRYVDKDGIYAEIRRHQAFMVEWHARGWLQFDPFIVQADPAELLQKVADRFMDYHYPAPYVFRGEQLLIANMPLIYYYHNRLGKMPELILTPEAVTVRLPYWQQENANG